MMGSAPRVAALLAIAAALATACASQQEPRAERTSPAAGGELFLFTYRPGPAWKTGLPVEQQGLGPHAAFMQRFVAEGRAFAAGPFAASDGGMAIVIARDLTEARAILAADPAISSGIFTATVEGWRPRFRTDAPLPMLD